MNNQSPIFTYHQQKGNLKGVLSIPHSGLDIPEEFKDYLTTNQQHRNQDVDTSVDKLVDIEKLNDSGIGVIVANIHRCCVDLNRSEDKAVFAWKQNSFEKQLITKDIDKEIENKFLKKYYYPYYEVLKALINEAIDQNQGPASFIDLHSMPSKPTEYHLRITPNQPLERPNFCISDISGISCEKDFIDSICKELGKSYDNITQNVPYFGGNITRGVHAMYKDINNIQIEICRKLYLNEVTKELSSDAQKLKPILTNALIRVFETFYKI